MAATEREVVPGLTSAGAREIVDQVFGRTDGNHPLLNVSGNGFTNILQNGKPDISASPVFVRKASL